MGRHDYDRYDRYDDDRYERRHRRRSSPTFRESLAQDGRRRRKLGGFDITLMLAVFGLSLVATAMGVSQDKYAHKEEDRRG